MRHDNVIPFRKAPEVGCDEHLLDRGVRVELIFDPDTDRWGIIVDNIEVINGLDLVGLRYPNGKPSNGMETP